ncbi:MAG: CHAT domain-containing protein [Limnothrix sp.]
MNFRPFGKYSWAVLWLGLAIAAAVPSTTQAQSLTSDEKVLSMERSFEADFENHFGRDLATVTLGSSGIADTLTRLDAETNTKSAVLWVMPREDSLHLVLVTADGETIIRDLFDVPKAELTAIANRFNQSISTPRRSPNLEAAQQLHEWIIKPFESEFLRGAGVNNLLVCLGDGVRGLPLAALYDGEQFLIEKYSLSRIPAFNLINTDYSTIQQGGILAMGASEFSEQSPLPAVPLELTTIVKQLRSVKPAKEEWSELSLLNQAFTQANLRAILENRSFDIVHLATHADFNSGAPANSYVQFSDRKVTLQEMSDFAWIKEAAPAVELLVLSACRTAVGDSEAELGFAGIALQAGVKSAIATLWNISDAGTLAFMSSLYREFSLHTTKAAAVRQTQLNMLRNDINFEDNQLVISPDNQIPIPDEIWQTAQFIRDFSHPYYWAGFSMISSPW